MMVSGNEGLDTAKGLNRRSLWELLSHIRNEATMIATNTGIATSAAVGIDWSWGSGTLDLARWVRA